VIVRFVDIVGIINHKLSFHNLGPRSISLTTRPVPKALWRKW